MRIFLLSLAFIITSSLAHAEDKKEITMGFNPAENVDMVNSKSEKFVEWFQKKTGMKVKTFVATDYTALTEALRSGRIDFAWMPPFSYVKAEEVAGAQVLLKTVRHGRAVYYSAIIVRADKGYNKIQDLKGKNIAWVDPSSTTGHIFPKANLKSRLGIDADKFFNKQIFAGAHDAVVLSVLNGTVDAGATYANDPKGKDGSWDMFLKGDAGKIKPIFISDPIPADGLATTKKFLKNHKDLVDLTVKTLMAMTKDPEGKKILEDLYHLEGLQTATSKDYEPVRAAAKAVSIE